jgi:hypothetical protein
VRAFGSGPPREYNGLQMGTAPHRLAPALLVAAGLVGCGEGGPTPPPSHPVLIVVNKCDSKKENGEYVFPLKELRLHQSLSDYGAAYNRLAAPLDPGSEVTLTDVEPRSWFVTVFRPMGPWQPQIVAVTGANPIDLSKDGIYRLLIYEEAFYLYPPTPHPDGMFRERGADGRRDAGARDVMAPDNRGDRLAGDTGKPADAKPVDAQPVDAGISDRTLQ